VDGMTQHKEDTFNQTGQAACAADPLPEERPVSIIWRSRWLRFISHIIGLPCFNFRENSG